MKSPTNTPLRGILFDWDGTLLNSYAADSAAPQSFGWMPADLLTVDTRVDGTITAYDRPDLLHWCC